MGFEEDWALLIMFYGILMLYKAFLTCYLTEDMGALVALAVLWTNYLRLTKSYDLDWLTVCVLRLPFTPLISLIYLSY
jgi:hypothetical protein